jgi:hypothetical protein
MGLLLAKGVYPIIVVLVVSAGFTLFLFKALWMLTGLVAEHLWGKYGARL